MDRLRSQLNQALAADRARVAEKALQDKIAADNDGWSDVEDDATVVVDDVLPVVEVNKVVEGTEVMDDKVADVALVAMPRKRGWFFGR